MPSAVRWAWRIQIVLWQAFGGWLRSAAGKQCYGGDDEGDDCTRQITMLASPSSYRMPDYHKLEVWTLVCELSDRVAELVTRLGGRLRPSMADQITRAADSIHENIAEGCGFNSDSQLAKFLRQARGSADEVQDQLEAVNRRGLILEGFEDLLPRSQVLCKKLARFISTVDAMRTNRRKRKADRPE